MAANDANVSNPAEYAKILSMLETISQQLSLLITTNEKLLETYHRLFALLLQNNETNELLGIFRKNL